MPRESDRNVAIREVVRGIRPWRDLVQFGVQVHVDATGVRELGTSEPPIHVSVVDIARGWLQKSGSEVELREWARFVHGAFGLVQLEMDSHPLGETILENLWRVTFNEPITPEMEEIARRALVAKG